MTTLVKFQANLGNEEITSSPNVVEIVDSMGVLVFFAKIVLYDDYYMLQLVNFLVLELGCDPIVFECQ